MLQRSVLEGKIQCALVRSGLPACAAAVQRGHRFIIVRLLCVLLRFQRGHRFLVVPRLLALRPHEQQPTGDHQRLQHAHGNQPDADLDHGLLNCQGGGFELGHANSSTLGAERGSGSNVGPHLLMESGTLSN